jgi:hypothetical protein
MNPLEGRLALAASLLFLALALPSEAAMQHRMAADALAPLSAPMKIGARVKIDRVPLADGEESVLELERFQVWADHAEIQVFGEGQEVVERLAPPAAQYFRGRVAGQPDSLVFMSTTGRRVDGMIWVGDRKFALGTARGEVVVQESSAIDDIPLDSETFRCEVEGTTVQRPARPRAVTNAAGLAVSPDAAPTGTQRSVINLAVETDSELYAKVSNSAANMTLYIGNLIAAVSTIYERDLKTEVRIVYLGMQNSAATDVFTITPGQTGPWNGGTVSYAASHAMYQLGDRWALTPPTANKYSAATLISGTPAGSGVGWVGTLCDGTFLCGGNCGSAAASGHFAGPFSFNGGITPPASLTAPNPDGNPDFGAGSGYWPLLQVSHELGHNVGSGHTHCIALSDAQKTQYNVTRNFVDVCFAGQSGCFAGSTSVPAEKGTIMSYCHLSGGGSSTRYTFGQDGETSRIVVNNMLANMAGVTPSMSSITAPASLDPNVTANASVTNAGHTYTWEIVNGTFTGGGTTASGASVSFAGTVSPVLLTVTATNSSGCAVSDTKSVTINALLEAPQGLTATTSGPASVAVAWSAVDGATGYEIFRSALGTGFVSIGTSDVPSFNDAGASTGTAYLYRVRPTAGASSGPFSNFDLATTTLFTNASLDAMTVKLAHFNELMSAVNAVRALAGLGSAAFTAPAPATNVSIRRAHVLDLRAALDAARAVLGLPALSYTDAVITAGSTTIKGAHITDLRNGLQ